MVKNVILLLFAVWTILFMTRRTGRRRTEWTEEEKRLLDKPLFLTPLIEYNETEKARHLSRVTVFEDFDIEAHSGYITVQKTFGSNLFFLLTKTKNSPEKAPLILWTFGGPGVSSLLGPLLFNGPLTLDRHGRLGRVAPSMGNLQSFAHVIYLDHPVGSGYSFAKHDADDRPFSKSINDSVNGIDEFLRQFELLFPEFQGRELYIAGESYSARDAFGYAYRYHRNSGDMKNSFKLAGIMSGAGLIAPFVQAANPAQFLLNIGLVGPEGRRKFDEKFRQIKDAVKDEEMLVALLLLREVFSGGDGHASSLYQNVTGYRHRASALHSTEPLEFTSYRVYLRSDDFKKAAHVGLNATMERQKSYVTNSLYAYDAFTDINDIVETVLENQRVLVYGGNMDVVYPELSTYRFLMTLKWSGEKDFKRTRRKPYTDASGTGEVVGYKLQVKNLTYALLVNAGHHVSFDKRAAVIDLYKEFVVANTENS